MGESNESQERANQLVAEANELMERGDKATAARKYVAAAELFPPYASFQLVAGDAYAESGRDADAVRAYRATVAAHPDHDHAWQSLGLALLRLGRMREATEALRTASELGAGIIEMDGDTLIAAYWGAVELEARAPLVVALAESADHPKASDVFEHYLRLGRGARVNPGLRVWEAQAYALTGLGVASDVEVYWDWRSPNEGAIAEDRLRYLEKAAEPSVATAESATSFWRRLWPFGDR